MKIIMLPIICAATICHAEATMKSSLGVAGVSFSRTYSRALTIDELKSVRMMATVDVEASTKNVTTTVNVPVMIKATHNACISTFFATEGDYTFTLDIGGQQTIVTEHIFLPARERTCVTKELYKQVKFPTPGNYMFSASSVAWTYSSGKKLASSSAFIIVN